MNNKEQRQQTALLSLYIAYIQQHKTQDIFTLKVTLVSKESQEAQQYENPLADEKKGNKRPLFLVLIIYILCANTNHNKENIIDREKLRDLLRDTNIDTNTKEYNSKVCLISPEKVAVVKVYCEEKKSLDIKRQCKEELDKQSLKCLKRKVNKLERKMNQLMLQQQNS